MIWSGSCDAGQLTPGGLFDAAQHGKVCVPFPRFPFPLTHRQEKKDLWELYHDRLGFLAAVDPAEIWVRTSTEDRTLQVAGAMLSAMNPRISGQPWNVHTQPASVSDAVQSAAFATYHKQLIGVTPPRY
jgi:hypothetical protein